MEAKEQEVTIHLDLWLTLISCTAGFINELTYNFNFHASLSGHASFVDIKPEHWITTINDIMTKNEMVPGGNQADLQKCVNI